MTGKSRIPRGSEALPEDGAHCSADSSGQGTASVPKAALRKRLLALRRNIEPASRARWDAALCGNLLALHEQTGFADLAVYVPLAGEPDLAAAYAQLAGRGVRLHLPVVLARGAALGFSAWTPGEAMHVDAMGIAVPAHLRLGDVPGTLLIPCLGWNREKFRLGYGGGFYDRTLAAPGRPLTIGVSYAMLEADFRSEAHDIALDIMITERNSW